MKTPYELIGGEAGLRKLVTEFYQIMSHRQEAETIRKMHKKDTTEIEEKLFMFLSGWMGGPDLYYQKTGSICLNKPHSAYSIGSDERDQWLSCMDIALDNTGASEELKEMIRPPLFAIADMMRNK